MYCTRPMRIDRDNAAMTKAASIKPA
jgi:hypothetical protein